MKTLLVNCDKNGIQTAVKKIEEGGVIVFPTDTVYGIGCNPYNSKAIRTIYQIKKRKISNQLPVLGFSKKELEKIAIFDEKSNIIANKFWPGAVTLVLKIKDEKIKKTLSLQENIAVRVPNNECLASILKKCKYLVGTSANISGEPPYTTAQECIKKLHGYDVIVDGGEISNKISSTVVQVTDKINVLREGTVSKKEILNLF